MGVIMYVSSLIISLFALIMTIITMINENVTKMFGSTETWFCLSISVVLIAIGILLEKR